jgi:AraC-like DNA-binding protein
MTGLTYQIVKPPAALSPFVESLWMLSNPTAEEKPTVLVPDGRVDIIFSPSDRGPHPVTLHGLESEPGQISIPAGELLFAVSFKLLAVEYLLHTRVAPNIVTPLPAGFWGVTDDDFQHFDDFCARVTAQMITLLPKRVDPRKQKLFDLIYTSHGAMAVQEFAEQVQWSSRQINRYFTQKFGISLKAFCNILRFRASFQHITEGKLFPEQNFTDQAHFIRDVKKYTGVTPRELHKNHGDRFIQFSILRRK